MITLHPHIKLLFLVQGVDALAEAFRLSHSESQNNKIFAYRILRVF